MKTTRDIAGRWARIQRRRAPSITASVEAKIRSEIITEYGSILDPDVRRGVEEKEYARRQKSSHSLSKSRRKILAQKEKAELIQSIRKDGRKHRPPEHKLPVPDQPVKESVEEEKRYEELEFEY